MNRMVASNVEQESDLLQSSVKIISTEEESEELVAYSASQFTPCSSLKAAKKLAHSSVILSKPSFHSVRINVAEMSGSKSMQRVHDLGLLVSRQISTNPPLHPWQYLTMHLQFSIHAPSRHMKRELALVFPSLFATGQDSRILVIPTFQRTSFNLISNTAESQVERDVCLEYIYAFAQRVVGRFKVLGYWADLADPTSGYPMFSDAGPSLYPDVDGAAHLLSYDTAQVNCCRVIQHPMWRGCNYPATLFTIAPPEIAQQVLQSCVDS